MNLITELLVLAVQNTELIIIKSNLRSDLRSNSRSSSKDRNFFCNLKLTVLERLSIEFFFTNDESNFVVIYYEKCNSKIEKIFSKSGSCKNRDITSKINVKAMFYNNKTITLWNSLCIENDMLPELISFFQFLFLRANSSKLLSKTRLLRNRIQF